MEPSMVECICGCGERFYGYHGEAWSAECDQRLNRRRAIARHAAPEGMGLTMEPQKYQNPGTPVSNAETVRVITLRDAVEEIRKLAEGAPHTVATSKLVLTSFYPDVPVRPHCLLGHAYADWGIPAADMQYWENQFGAERWLPGTGPEGDGGPVDFLEYGLRFTAAAAAFLLQCQKMQDYGIEWRTVFQTMLGRAHVVFGTELHDEGDLYEHGEPLSWPELIPRVINHG